VVDDEPETVKYLSANLRARGYDVLTAGDGHSALKLLGESQVDLAILDIMLPDTDGFQVCQMIRARSNMPILMLSARGQERDIVRALDLGADDYLTKPFGVEELMARVRAVLRRRTSREAQSHPPLVLPGGRPGVPSCDLTINLQSRTVTLGDQFVSLTATEFDLLAHLALHAGRVLTHRALLQAVWGPEYGDETEYLWTYVRRLRQKIEPDPHHPRFLLTQPGVGYRLADLP